MYVRNGVSKTVSVVVPTRNEARNIGWVLDRMPAFVDEVVVVDGNSVDDTIAVALTHRPDAVVVRQARRGKGNALAAGFEAASCDVIVIVDADGSMDPEEVAGFVDPLLDRADYVTGSRFMQGGGSEDITFIRKLGNWWLTTVVNTLFGSRYTDINYGMHSFTRECHAVFALPAATVPGAGQYGDGFEIETLMNLRVVQAGVRVLEVPSFEFRRRFGQSNLNAVRDGFRVLGTILRERVTTPAAARKVAAPAGAVVEAADAPALSDVVTG